MQELEIERNRPAVSNKSSEKKFYNVDAVQDEPIPVQVLDPLQQSPAIPRKRHESSNSDQQNPIAFEFSAAGPFDPSNPNPRNRHESFDPFPRQRHESSDPNPRYRHDSSDPNPRNRHESSDSNLRYRHESSDPRKRHEGCDPYPRKRHESSDRNPRQRHESSDPSPRPRHESYDPFPRQESSGFRRGTSVDYDENNSRLRSNSLPRGGKPLLR